MKKNFFYIIDDDPDICEILEIMVEDLFEGCKAKSFTTAQDAKESLLKESIYPDVILCDVSLEHTSGFAWRHELLDENINIPMIFITGMGGDDFIEDDYVVIGKPINRLQLKGEIQRLLE